jgi:hypothetical protein
VEKTDAYRVARYAKNRSKKAGEDQDHPIRCCGAPSDAREMGAYLDAWFEEAPDDAAGIARALGDIERAKG